MPQKQYEEAEKHYTNAAEASKKAKESYAQNDHKTGASHGKTAQGHAQQGKRATQNANEEHAKKYSNS